MTGLPSGMFVLAAYDDADNVSTTMPYQIRITDMKAPEPPTNFNAVVSRTGIATLTWDQPLSDDVAHYDLFFVNDTTHQPTQRNTGELTDDFYQDTLALDVNQRYIYYKVRAVDYSGNFGEFTPWLQVERPSLVPPSVCHLDTAWNDEKGIHMNWVIGRDAALDFHNIYRRLAGENEWRLLDIIYQRDILATGDTVMVLCDKPAYNRHNRYEYAIESFNNTGISSGLSLAYSTLYKGPDIIDVPVKLIGTYEAKNGETRLAWDAKPPKSEGDYYYCVYRRTEGEGIFRFLLSTKANEPMLSDYNTQPGQEAEYYVIVRFDNGRVSQRSNEEVYWSSTNPAIVKLHNDTLIALMPGTCTIVATSVQRRLTDRCVVNVSHSWSFVPDGYRYDMVVYADITHDGRPIGEEFAVGAFYRDTLRGVARKRHDGGKDYYVIRIYSNQAKGEDITLNSYNAKTGEVKPVDFHIIFDGEAHGSLSAPVKISI